MQQMQCTIEKTSYYSVVIFKSIDCILIDQNLGSKIVKVNRLIVESSFHIYILT